MVAACNGSVGFIKTFNIFKIMNHGSVKFCTHIDNGCIYRVTDRILKSTIFYDVILQQTVKIRY